MKKLVKIVTFNLVMIAIAFVVMAKRFLGLNFLNFYQTPVRLGISWSFVVFWLGIFIYFNLELIKQLWNTMKHNENLVVKDVVLTDLEDALDKLKKARRENPKLYTEITSVSDHIEEFQRKLDIMNQLLANHGQKLVDWSFIVDFNNESRTEILIYVRQALNTTIVFDDEKATHSQLNTAQNQIQEYVSEIVKISVKYDEFLNVVKQVLERKLHSPGTVITDSLDITIDSVKKAYGIIEDEPM